MRSNELIEEAESVKPHRPRRKAKTNPDFVCYPLLSQLQAEVWSREVGFWVAAEGLQESPA